MNFFDVSDVSHLIRSRLDLLAHVGEKLMQIWQLSSALPLVESLLASKLGSLSFRLTLAQNKTECTFAVLIGQVSHRSTLCKVFLSPPVWKSSARAL